MISGKITIAIAILLPFFSAGQTISDTTYQVAQGGKFYEVREVVFADGSGSNVRTLIGDTLTIFNNSYSAFVAEGNRMANDARAASQFDAITTRMIQQAGAVFAITGRDLLDTLSDRYAKPLLIQGWELRDTADTDISFNINANGQLRYQLAGYPARNAVIIANTMRLLNFANTARAAIGSR